MNIKSEKEIYWKSTKELDIEINGKEYCVRVVEDSNGSDIIYLDKHKRWSDLYEGEANGDVDIENLNEIYKAWEEGELH